MQATGDRVEFDIWFGAMVIRCRDTEADADADTETQITIDFEAEGSSTDAYQKQSGSSCEAKLTQVGRMKDANTDTISFVKAQRVVSRLQGIDVRRLDY